MYALFKDGKQINETKDLHPFCLLLQLFGERLYLTRMAIEEGYTIEEVKE